MFALIPDLRNSSCRCDSHFRSRSAWLAVGLPNRQRPSRRSSGTSCPASATARKTGDTAYRSQLESSCRESSMPQAMSSINNFFGCSEVILQQSGCGPHHKAEEMAAGRLSKTGQCCSFVCKIHSRYFLLV